MYLAINKHNKNEYHSFVWDEDGSLIINWVKVNPADWDIIEVAEVNAEPSTDTDCTDPDCWCRI